MNSKIVIKKIIYWILCTILIIFLFILIFGLAAIANEKGFKVELFIALLFGAIGSTLVILSIYKPLSLLGFSKLPSNDKKDETISGLQIYHMIYGFSMLIGSVCYLKYSNIYVLLLFLFLLPAAIIRVLFAATKK